MIKSLRSGADRAAFEANKLMRLQRVQLEQKSKEQQRQAAVEQLGEAVWRLYVQGKVSDPDLVTLCHLVQTITHEIVELQKTIAEVRNEQASRPFKCLDCGHDLNAEDTFCPFCGAKTAPAGPEPLATQAALTCPGCGGTLRPGAVFCGKCGRRQVQPSQNH